jgi:hypothetical protein
MTNCWSFPFPFVIVGFKQMHSFLLPLLNKSELKLHLSLWHHTADGSPSRAWPASIYSSISR